MNSYIYIEKVSFLKKIIGSIILISGIIGLFFINFKRSPEFIFLWVFLCFLGVFLASTLKVKVNFKSKCFIFFYSIYGIHFAFNWKYFSEIKYISLLETTITQKIGGRGFTPTEATLSGKKSKNKFI